MSLVLSLVTVGLARYGISPMRNVYRHVVGGTMREEDIFNFPNAQIRFLDILKPVLAGFLSL